MPSGGSRCAGCTHRSADVGDDAVTELEVLDVLAHLDDLAYRLVPGDEGELGDELALVDVAVCSANAAEGNCCAA